MKRLLPLLLLLPLTLFAQETERKFVTIGAHAAFGTSGVTHNLRSVYPAINELDLNSGMNVGIGASARMHLSQLLSLGVEASLFINNYRNNLAVADDDATSMTACYIRNRFLTVNIPVFLEAGVDIGPHVRWLVALGAYYSYGLWGRSSTDMYRWRVNELGQFTTTIATSRPSYYNSPDAFIYASQRGDMGVHGHTGLLITRRVLISLRAQLGLLNIARTYRSPITPNIHNWQLMGQAAWLF